YPSLWSIRPDGSGRHHILPNRQNAKRPSLSPDRRWIAFDGAPPGTPPLTQFHVQLVRVDGTGVQTLAGHGTGLWELDAQWSPDGKRILFTRFGSDGADVYVMRADGSHVRRLTRARGDDVGAAWSPDGSKILFTSDRTGLSQLYVMAPDGCDQRTLSPSRTT